MGQNEVEASGRIDWTVTDGPAIRGVSTAAPRKPAP